MKSNHRVKLKSIGLALFAFCLAIHLANASAVITDVQMSIDNINATNYTLDEDDIPSLTSSWASTVDASRLVGIDSLNGKIVIYQANISDGLTIPAPNISAGTFSGDFDFANAITIGGGFGNNGVTIDDGSVWIAGGLYIMGNMTNINVTNLNTNGSLIPTITGVFDLGDSANVWRNLHVTNITATNYNLEENDIPSLTSSWAGALDAERLSGIDHLNYKTLIYQANITGGITIPQANISDGITIPSTNVTAGSFGSGDYTFLGNLDVANNMNVVKNLTVGTDVLYADQDSGKVGIGTINPLQKLVVVGDLNVTGQTYFGIQSFTNIDASGNLGVGRNLTVSNNVLFVDNNTGRVGIGTTSPSYDIDIAGDARIQGGELYLSGIASSASTTEGTLYYDTDDDQVKVYANGKWQSDRMTASVTVAAGNSRSKEKADYVCDGSNDEVEIQSAMTAAGRGTVVLLAGDYNIGSSFTVPSNISLSFEHSANLSISNGVTVTFNGPIDAGIYQIFSGTGLVSIDPTYTLYAYPQWWGAKGDGSIDDTIAVQKALNASKFVFFPKGTYLVTSSINATGKLLKGVHMDQSIIQTNNNDINILLPDQSKVYDMGIQGSGNAGSGSCLYLDQFGLAEFYNIKVSKCPTGVKIRNAWDISFYSSEIGPTSSSLSNLDYDVDIDGSSPGDQAGQFRFYGTRFNSNNLNGPHIRIVSATPGIVSGCHIAYGTTHPGIYISNSYGWTFSDISLESVNYSFNVTNSQFVVLGYKGSPNVTGFLHSDSGLNNNIIYLSDYKIGIYAGPSSYVTISAEDGYGNPFNITRRWGVAGEETILSVSETFAPYYDQNYQWGSGRAGNHTWYAGKAQAMTLNRTGRLSLLAGPFVERGFQTFADGDATPSVSSGNNFKTANTGATSISMFDDGADGQQIRVVFGDGNTTVDFTDTNLKGNVGVDWSPAQSDHMNCVFDGTNWYCDISDNTA